MIRRWFLRWLYRPYTANTVTTSTQANNKTVMQIVSSSLRYKLKEDS